MIRLICFILISASCTLFADIAPPFNGRFDVAIHHIDEVVLESNKIILRGSGGLVTSGKGPHEDLASRYLEICIWKTTWNASHKTSWADCITKINRLKDFQGTLTATDAGWAAFSGAFLSITCSDLFHLEKK